MNNELQKKVLDDLEKAGFHSEMMAIQAFLKAKWQCTGAAGFFDLDEQKTREFDIDAYSGIGEDIRGVLSTSVIYHMAVEVKKSLNPWIVFKVGSMPWYKVYEFQNLVFSQNIPALEKGRFTSLDVNTIAEKEKWVATSIHESFKRPESPSRWYSAVVTACKAAEHILRNYGPKPNAKSTNPPQRLNEMAMFVVIRPVVVLDGILLAAEILETGEATVSEIEWAALNFTFETAKYTTRNYRVDLVTLNKLPDYIRLAEARFNGINEEIVKKIKGYD